MKIKLMIVDDEEDFVDALVKRLTMRDFEVAYAYSGESAIAQLEENPVDIVMLDVKMQGLSGTDTLQRIKQLWPLVQVIMLTGHATVDNAITGMKYGAYDYLTKPVDIAVLDAKIRGAYQVRTEQIERIRKAEVETIITRRGW